MDSSCCRLCVLCNRHYFGCLYGILTGLFPHVRYLTCTAYPNAVYIERDVEHCSVVNEPPEPVGIVAESRIAFAETLLDFLGDGHALDVG